MAPYMRMRSERYSKEEVVTPCLSLPHRLAAMAVLCGGPLMLLYLIIRCEKNQCVLFQLPVVLPNHLSAYFSTTAALLLFGYLFLMYLLSTSKSSMDSDGQMKGVPPSFSGLLTISLVLVGLALTKPEMITMIHAEYLRLFSVTLLFAVILNTALFLMAQANTLTKERDYCWPLAFFYGNRTRVYFGRVELKYFLYVNCGLVAWGVLDLLLILNAIVEGTLSATLAFVGVTQYTVVAHDLLFENFLRTKPFNETEGLGFYWMLKVLLYLPFLHSLPVYYAATTEAALARPALMANCVFFLFGFVIYISSLHQKENFVADPGAHKNIKSMPYLPGKRLMVGGYWGIVQKPDYLGYMIMWLSWTLACGLSGVPLLVLVIVYTSLLIMLLQTSKMRQKKYGAAWSRYTAQVPFKLIPHAF